jgi:outer membrane protein assembly factor BamA
MVKEPKKQKGFKYWLKYKVGEPPVIASASALEKNRQVIQNHFDNKGYFQDSVLMDTSVKNKKLKVTYTATMGSRYRVREISYPGDSTVLAQQIQKATTNKKDVLIKPSDPYDLDVIKNERTRIDARLKENGFFYFGPDYLIADIDSTIGNRKVDIDMRVKPETPFPAREQYYINDVYVFSDFDINSDTSLIGAKKFEGYTIIDPYNKFNPKIFSRTLVFKAGDLYNRTDHNLSLNRLITLGVYKFVKVRFEPSDTANKLNAFYYLTPTNKKSIRFEVSALQKTNNSTGTQLSVNWRNRNLLKGAELLTVSAYTGAERQVSSSSSVNTLTGGTEVNLYVPRILAPFNLNTSSAFVPQTRFRAQYELYNKTTEYLLTSALGSVGYIWKTRIPVEHELTPLIINYVQPRNITDSFQKVLDSNIVLARSIEQQFILGNSYNYNYNTLARANTDRNNFFFNGNVSLSGNLIGLITGANVKTGNQKEIFGTPFNQYVRFEADGRYYRRLGTQFRSFNARVLGGVGIAYGNTLNMPFIKAFFAGGVSDQRGFRARTLGPGSYYAGNPRDTFVADQPGDIKLLTMLEYRDRLFSIVRWAAFVDAGNVWTLREDTDRPGAKFTSQFLNQVAIDAGLGLRFDISFLVFRVDIAFPLRLPYLPPDGKNAIDIGNADWRKNNIVWNLAIGYPF